MKKSKKSIEISKKTDEPYNIGDFCYYIYSDNKVYLGEIQKVYENEKGVYTLIDQQSHKFITVSHDQCFDDEKQAKIFAKNKKKEK